MFFAVFGVWRLVLGDFHVIHVSSELGCISSEVKVNKSILGLVGSWGVTFP